MNPPFLFHLLLSIMDLSSKSTDAPGGVVEEAKPKAPPKKQGKVAAAVQQQAAVSATEALEEPVVADVAPAIPRMPTPEVSLPKPEPTRPVARAGVPRGTPDSKIYRVPHGAYDDHGELVTEAYGDASKKQHFYAYSRNMRLKIYVRRDDPDGDYMYYPHSVVFNGGHFSTDDQAVIDALREHTSFGGTRSSGYEDRPLGAREALFWGESLPPDLIAKREKEAREYSTVKGHHEE